MVDPSVSTSLSISVYTSLSIHRSSHRIPSGVSLNAHTHTLVHQLRLGVVVNPPYADPPQADTGKRRAVRSPSSPRTTGPYLGAVSPWVPHPAPAPSGPTTTTTTAPKGCLAVRETEIKTRYAEMLRAMAGLKEVPNDRDDVEEGWEEGWAEEWEGGLGGGGRGRS